MLIQANGFIAGIVPFILSSKRFLVWMKTGIGENVQAKKTPRCRSVNSLLKEVDELARHHHPVGFAVHFALNMERVFF